MLTGLRFNFLAERVQTNNVVTPTTNGKVPNAKEPCNGSASLKFDGSNGSMTSTGNHEATWVHEIFQGILTSETRCLNCETVSCYTYSIIFFLITYFFIK